MVTTVKGEAYTKQMMSIYSVYTCRHMYILKYTLWKFNRLPLNICHPNKNFHEIMKLYETSFPLAACAEAVVVDLKK